MLLWGRSDLAPPDQDSTEVLAEPRMMGFPENKTRRHNFATLVHVCVCCSSTSHKTPVYYDTHHSYAYLGSSNPTANVRTTVLWPSERQLIGPQGEARVSEQERCAKFANGHGWMASLCSKTFIITDIYGNGYQVNALTRLDLTPHISSRSARSFGREMARKHWLVSPSTQDK